jgi:hypothetical protein
VLVLLVTASAVAELPWQKLVAFKRIEADPNNAYPLSDQQGPWMIMAITFKGPEAESQAQELVYELRSVHKMPAYSHKVHLQLGSERVGRGLDQYGNPLRMKYRTAPSDETAVLIGDFASIDDPQAKKMLDRVKQLSPACLDSNKGSNENRKASPAMASWRAMENAMLSRTNPGRTRGPLGMAFIISNPLIPKEYFAPRGLDKMVVDMNKPLKYSLLSCRGRYSVKIATFTGKVIYNQDQIKEVQSGKRQLGGTLEEAAEQAHTLTEALRAKGYEAYEFHDRGSSIVTVGSFESVGTPRADGKIEINPQVHAIMQTFGPDSTITSRPSTTNANTVSVRTIAGVALDPQPIPVLVPRHSVVVDYSRMVGR